MSAIVPHEILTGLVGMFVLGVGYFLGLWHGTPKFLRCRSCQARLHGLCPHCKREYRL